MTFRRGAALTTATTLGLADNADVGPTGGTGVFRRWPDDLAALQEADITDIRITLDWARLQPKPGIIDDDWAEWFEQVLIAADAIGLQPWVTLHDGSIPRWFDNDGGFDDDANFTRWWPRWVGLAADRFGDRARGWVPFAALPTAAWQVPWADTWTTLRGDAPVVASIDPASIDVAALLVDRCDATGLPATIDIDPERLGQSLRDVADATDAPVAVSSLRWSAEPSGEEGHDPSDASSDEPSDDQLADGVAAAVRAITDAIDDGVDVPVAFIDPAIALPGSPALLFDADRHRSPAATAFLT